MIININRDRVCLGDDMQDHAIRFIMRDDATYEELFRVLKEKQYFPCVAGNNVVWVMTTQHYECMFSYFTKTEKFSMGLLEKSLRNLCGDSFDGHLKYYSNPQKMERENSSDISRRLLCNVA